MRSTQTQMDADGHTHVSPRGGKSKRGIVSFTNVMLISCGDTMQVACAE